MVEMRARVLSTCLSTALVAAAVHGEERQPSHALARYRAGIEALESAEVERAIREFREAVRLDPLLGPAHYELGRSLMVQRRYPEAVQALVAARDAFRQADAAAREARTRAALESKVKTLDDVDYHELDHNRRFPMAYVFEPGRTRALDVPKDRDARPARVVPAEVLAVLGSAHHHTGALAEAEQEYLEALAINPGLGEAHNNLAVVYLQTGRIAEAEREVARSEEAGFRVSPGLKREIAAGRPR